MEYQEIPTVQEVVIWSIQDAPEFFIAMGLICLCGALLMAWLIYREEKRP